MPEELTEEQTRAAFAGMRAETLVQVLPPGAAEAVRTIRRRRRRGVAAVAAGVAIAVAGGATAVSLVNTHRPALPAAPRPSPSRSALSPAQLNHLASVAAAKLGIEHVNNIQRKLEGKGAILSHQASPVMLAGPGGGGLDGKGPHMATVPFGGGDSYNLNKTGVYVFEILCVGEGTLRARVWAGARPTSQFPSPPSSSADLVVPCSTEPITAGASVYAPYPEMIFFWVEADQETIGRAAYAWLERIP